MAGSRYSLIPKAFWQYLGPAYSGLDADLEAVESAVESALTAPGAGTRVVTHGTDPNVARPNVGLVIWEGSVAPNNAAGTDFWRVP